MADVLFVSKPIAPPWNDGTKNLVRDLAASLRKHHAVVLTRRGEAAGVRAARVEELYPRGAGGFAPALRDNARVAYRLAFGPREDLWHFFFAPNPRSSAVGRRAAALRRVPTVHTIASAPREGVDPRPLLFADVNVVLSRHTEARLHAAGVDASRVRRIEVPLAAPALLDEAARHAARERFGASADRPLVVYPGDLEHGDGARRMIDALAELGRADVHLAMACRPKTPRAREAEATLRAHASSRGLGEGRVRWLGEIPDILALLGAADVVALPSTDLYAKVDFPLVLLEAMALERPVVVVEGSPAAELADGGTAARAAPDAADVASVIRGLLDHPARATALGVAARARVLRDHDPRTVAVQYEALYDALLASSPAAS